MNNSDNLSIFVNVLQNEVFPRINWKCFNSFYIAGTLAYAPTKFLLPESDIDLVAVTSNLNKVENEILDFTSQEKPLPDDIRIDSLETVFSGTTKRVSLHTFTQNAIEKIAKLETSTLSVWRTPKTKFQYDWYFPSVDGKKIQHKLRVQEFDNALLCDFPITVIENGVIHFGPHPQEFLTHAIPLIDDHGFLIRNILLMQQNIFRLSKDFDALHALPFNQFWQRHDQVSLSILKMRSIVSKLGA